MVASSRFFSSVLLAVLYASYGQASPTSATLKHTTHKTVLIGRDLEVETFHPQTSYKTFGEGVDLPLSFTSAKDDDKTVSFVASQLQIDRANLSYKSGYTNEAHQVGYARQVHDGVPFVNAVANVAFKGNKAVAFGSSFIKTDNIADSKPTVDVNTVISKIEEALQGKKNDVAPTVEYLALDDGRVALVHVFQVQNKEARTWYEAYVDAHSGDLLSVTDFVNRATYKVLPIWKTDPGDWFDPEVEIVTDPDNRASSPNGWHGLVLDTSGNNAISYSGSLRQTTSSSNFQKEYDSGLPAGLTSNLDAGRVNAFYVINSYHDVLYQYGWTETAFNFQNDNFGKGGLGNDRVDISVQDSADTDNAYFTTPPEGTSPLCEMFIWTYTNPTRDGAMENDIPIHEVTHGLTNRLTGGGTARCLTTLEALGMGEGWSDAMADWFAHSNSASITDFAIGAWVTNNPRGIRAYPYSTSATTNPLKYSSIARLNEEHAIGEVWANTLHNVYAALVGALGYSNDARTNANGTGGNVVFLHLFVDALALQPCNPTLPTGRDAWIQADQNRYGGANKCTLWKAFASRGLGVGAANYVDSTTVPDGC